MVQNRTNSCHFSLKPGSTSTSFNCCAWSICSYGELPYSAQRPMSGAMATGKEARTLTFIHLNSKLSPNNT